MGRKLELNREAKTSIAVTIPVYQQLQSYATHGETKSDTLKKILSRLDEIPKLQAKIAEDKQSVDRLVHSYKQLRVSAEKTIMEMQGDVPMPRFVDDYNKKQFLLAKDVKESFEFDVIDHQKNIEL